MIRKLALTSLTIFYLLLSTGSFIVMNRCTVSCLLAGKHCGEDCSGKAGKGCKDSDCDNDKDCPCCWHQSIYIAFENTANPEVKTLSLFKPTGVLSFQEICNQRQTFLCTVYINHHPPWFPGKDTLIKTHSLLI